MSEPLITPALVLLDADLGSTKTQVINRLAALVAATGRAEEAGLAADALAREEKAVTGLGGGIAIPHCRSAAVNTNTLAFARLSPKVDFGAADGPADLAFMIAASEGSDDAHLTLLRFDPDHGRVWVSDKGALGFGYEILKANLTKSMPDEGGVADVNLQ